MTAVPAQPTPPPDQTRPPVTVRPMTPLERRMSEDLEWASGAPEVQQHKGQLQVETDPGEYAEFIITLPKTAS